MHLAWPERQPVAEVNAVESAGLCWIEPGQNKLCSVCRDLLQLFSSLLDFASLEGLSSKTQQVCREKPKAT